ncbi:MAG: class I SAM-dependent methyltransferase [Clostridiaceae bacterium]|nr:class I SAM-dependent methyltransferase [Clostridiaceae bacterium]
MEAYSALAPYYDAFNRDVPYDGILRFYQRLFERAGVSPQLVLDLACGTGAMSVRLAEAGYEVIAADASSQMLSIAAGRPVSEKAVAPIYLCQRMERLDLYGTIDAAVCCLDGVGYVTKPETLARAFSRVRLFLNPGGVFIFDVNSAYRLRHLHEMAFTRECDRAFCVYQADFSEKTKILTYTLDLFEREGRLYRRSTEYHHERAYEVQELTELLLAAGFTDVEPFGDCREAPPAPDEGRIFFLAKT